MKKVLGLISIGVLALAGAVAAPALADGDVNASVNVVYNTGAPAGACHVVTAPFSGVLDAPAVIGGVLWPAGTPFSGSRTTFDIGSACN